MLFMARLLMFDNIRSEFHLLDPQEIKGVCFLCPSQFFPFYAVILRKQPWEKQEKYTKNT